MACSLQRHAAGVVGLRSASDNVALPLAIGQGRFACGAEFELSYGTTFGVWSLGPDTKNGAGYAALLAVGDINAALTLFRSRDDRRRHGYAGLLLRWEQMPTATRSASISARRTAKRGCMTCTGTVVRVRPTA